MKVEETNPEKPTRRSFLNYLLGGSVVAWAAAVLYPVMAYLVPPKQAEVEVSSVNLGKLGDMEKDSGQIVRFGNKPVIVVRSADGDVKAFSATCTHLDCTVQYKKEEKVIWCACHNGKFDLNGKNVAGPPPRPLDPFRVTIKDDEILVSRMT